MRKKNKIKRIDIFPHSGLKIPVEALKYLKKDLGNEKIQEVILKNADTGLEEVIKTLKSREDESHLVLVYEYARVLGDINRLDPENQIPDVPYIGGGIIENIEKVREEIIEKYVIKYQKKLLEIIKDNPDAIVIYWHTMDTFNNGHYDMEVSEGKRELRPMGGILTRIDAERKSLVKYFPSLKEDVYECELVTKDFGERQRKILSKAMKRFDTYKGREFMLNYPFKLFGKKNGRKIYGPSLPNLVCIAQKGKKNNQITVDVRKDLLYTEPAQNALINSIDEIVNSIIRKDGTY